jgi:ferredoxin--NADP+ reductase
VPFDPRRGTALNQSGRVFDADTNEPLPGTYVAGWFKRGPSGVIGTNKKCAQETTELLLADFGAGKPPTPTADADELLKRLCAAGHVVDYAGWESIDAHERALGEPSYRPRMKLVHLRELLGAAGTGTPSLDSGFG